MKRVVRQKAKGPIDPEFGKRLRRLREVRGMSQVQLAGGDFSKGFISLLETGRTRCSLRAAEIFARRLGVGVAELLAYEPPKPLDGIADLANRLAFIARQISNPQQQLVLRALAVDANRLAKRRVVSVAAVHQRVERALRPLRELEEATKRE